jgi:hypothetical protein
MSSGVEAGLVLGLLSEAARSGARAEPAEARLPECEQAELSCATVSRRARREGQQAVT